MCDFTVFCYYFYYICLVCVFVLSIHTGGGGLRKKGHDVHFHLCVFVSFCQKIEKNKFLSIRFDDVKHTQTSFIFFSPCLTIFYCPISQKMVFNWTGQRVESKGCDLTNNRCRKNHFQMGARAVLQLILKIS